MKIAIPRSGGVTGRRQAPGLGASCNRGVPSYPLPEERAHFLAATLTQHRLEYVDWAAPILPEPLRMAAGMAIVLDQPDDGMHWDAAAITNFPLD